MKNWNTRLDDVIGDIDELATAANKTEFMNQLGGTVRGLSQDQQRAFSEALHVTSHRGTNKLKRRYLRAIAFCQYATQAVGITLTVQQVLANALTDLRTRNLTVAQLQANLDMYISVRDTALAAHDGQRYRPLRVGMGIGQSQQSGPGTVACFVRCNRNREPMLLGNYHVMKQRPNDDDVIINPARNHGGSPMESIATFDRGTIDGTFDCAVAYLNDGLDFDNVTPEGTRITGAYDQYARNDAVWKRGVSSRVTNGTIGEVSDGPFINPAHTGKYGTFPGTFANQIHVYSGGVPFQIPGDSGAGLFNNRNQIIGLMHMKTDRGGCATPIDQVFNQLDVDFYA